MPELRKDEQLVACPECNLIGNHTGICANSLMMSGKIILFVGRRIEEPEWESHRNSQRFTV